MDTAGVNTVEEVLQHFGIRGMKWGVRKAAPPASDKKVAKLDKKFEKASINPNTHMALWLQSVKSLKKSGDLKAINNKPEYAASKFRLRLGVAKRDLQHKYEDEIAGKLMQHIRKNASEIVNRSGTRQFAIDQVYRPSGKKGQKVLRESNSQWRIVTTDIRQASDGSLLITVVRDEVGRIIDLIPQEDLEQSAVLAHFGIKGMKWGSRKKPLPVSADAAQKQSVKAQVKETKIASVSSAQLQAAMNRMQLEQNYKRLATNEKSAVTRWLANTFLEIGKKEVGDFAQKKASAAIGKALASAVAKKVVTGGVA